MEANTSHFLAQMSPSNLVLFALLLLTISMTNNMLISAIIVEKRQLGPSISLERMIQQRQWTDLSTRLASINSRIKHLLQLDGMLSEQFNAIHISICCRSRTTLNDILSLIADQLVSEKFPVHANLVVECFFKRCE